MAKKVPTKISPSYLENAALHYLERYASSSSNLKRVMMRKVDRSLAHWGGDRETCAAQLDTVIAKLARLGYLNDAAYAEQKTRSLHRQGRGSRTIRATLAAKGIAPDTVDAAINTLYDETSDPEFTAAVKLARKKKLGPFRVSENPEERREMRNKDLTVMARAGFDFDTARRVIDAESVEGLEAEGAG